MSECVFRTDEPIEDCEECPIATVTNFITWCPLKKCGIKKGYSFRDCPLVELPELHGDLIDRDKLAEEFEKYEVEETFVFDLLFDAPTVLEASEE